MSGGPASAAATPRAEGRQRDAGGTKWLRTGLVALVRFYQGFVSPLMPLACRFHPTCSQYACEAIERHGARRGVWLAAGRLLRCRPFGAFGYDPVPEDVAPTHRPEGRRWTEEGVR